MELEDFFALVHPAIAVIVVFPLIGIVINRAWLVRQRRLQVADGEKSKIPPIVGSEHVAIGNWLSSSVVGVALLGMADPIFVGFLKNDTFSKEPLRALFVIAIFLVVITSFTLVFKSKVKIWRNVFKVKIWRNVFAGLTSIGLVNVIPKLKPVRNLHLLTVINFSEMLL